MQEVDLERVICRVDDVEDHSARGFAIGGGDWPLKGVVTRRGHEVHAFVNRCPHLGHPLNLQPHEFMTVDRTLVLCRSHGAAFEPTTGRCVMGPCAGASLTRVPVVVDAGYVLLAEGVDPATLVRD